MNKSLHKTAKNSTKSIDKYRQEVYNTTNRMSLLAKTVNFILEVFSMLQLRVT